MKAKSYKHLLHPTTPKPKQVSRAKDSDDTVRTLIVVAIHRRLAGLRWPSPFRLPHLVLGDVLILGQEDLTFPERDGGEHGEDEPCGAHDANEDEMQRVEGFDVQRIAKSAQGGDPTNYGKFCEKAVNTRGENVYAPLGKVRAQHPRISQRCLWTFTHHGRTPNTNKNIARPNSSKPARTEAEYQISPESGETRSCAGRLKGR